MRYSSCDALPVDMSGFGDQNFRTSLVNITIRFFRVIFMKKDKVFSKEKPAPTARKTLLPLTPWFSRFAYAGAPAAQALPIVGVTR